MKTFTAMTAAVALGLSLTGAAHAGPGRTARVSHADLDLSRAADRAALEQRIHHAIRRMCAPRPGASDFIDLRIARTCRELAWADVQPQLVTIYDGRRLAQSAILVSAGAQ